MQRSVNPSRRHPVSLKSRPPHTCTQAARAAVSHLSTQVSGHFLFMCSRRRLICWLSSCYVSGVTMTTVLSIFVIFIVTALNSG